jgi:hypothetical protein
MELSHAVRDFVYKWIHSFLGNNYHTVYFRNGWFYIRRTGGAVYDELNGRILRFTLISSIIFFARDIVSVN